MCTETRSHKHAQAPFHLSTAAPELILQHAHFPPLRESHLDKSHLDNFYRTGDFKDYAAGIVRYRNVNYRANIYLTLLPTIFQKQTWSL